MGYVSLQEGIFKVFWMLTFVFVLSHHSKFQHCPHIEKTTLSSHYKVEGTQKMSLQVGYKKTCGLQEASFMWVTKNMSFPVNLKG